MKDILFNGSDLIIKNGDFWVENSENQHVEHLLKANPGDYKQFPITGVNIPKYLASPLPNINNRLIREIRLQCLDNQINVNQILLIGSQIVIE